MTFAKLPSLPLPLFFLNPFLKFYSTITKAHSAIRVQAHPCFSQHVGQTVVLTFGICKTCRFPIQNKQSKLPPRPNLSIHFYAILLPLSVTSAFFSRGKEEGWGEASLTAALIWILTPHLFFLVYTHFLAIKKQWCCRFFRLQCNTPPLMNNFCSLPRSWPSFHVLALLICH